MKPPYPTYPILMHLHRLILACMLLLGLTATAAARVVYTSQDSARVVELLRTETGEEDVLFYARQFLGLPYVAHTLEVSGPECLVVNLRELDCTTFVETVCALTLTHRQGKDSFDAFCENLERMRYMDGRMDGYCSRLHYFTWWMQDNIKKGLVGEVTDPQYFTACITVNNFYMSRHPDNYALLKGHPDRVREIRRLEKAYNGPGGNYLPQKHTGLSRQQLDTIHSGDIVAIVTTKAGLDYSHLGFAVWEPDGKLHMIHASSQLKKVVEDTRPLQTYLSGISTSIGVRLLRLK